VDVAVGGKAGFVSAESDVRAEIPATMFREDGDVLERRRAGYPGVQRKSLGEAMSGVLRDPETGEHRNLHQIQDDCEDNCRGKRADHRQGR
jgi:hypothetical protein